MKLYPELSLLI